MSCVLRAAGRSFDVDAFLAECKVPPLSTWRRGEKRSQRARSSETSGVRFQVSTADFSNLSAQITDALAFLQVHHELVAKLVAFSGVESVVADFGAESKPPHWASYVFESSLLSALGQAGVSLEISVYPSAEEGAGNA